MQPSIVGLAICVVLLLIGWRMGGPIVIGLIASLAFGSTAGLILHALGGSSPLIYCLFGGMILAASLLRRRIWLDLGRVVADAPVLWVLGGLVLYVAVGAAFLPRLFLGETSVFVVDVGVGGRGGIVELTLAPVSGNVTQPGYLFVSAFTALALCVMLVQKDMLQSVRRGFLLLAALNLGMGLVDLVAKSAGMGDVLGFLKTANYAMLDQEYEGFQRLNGAFPEPSSFAAASLASFAFCYTYWRRTGDRVPKWLAIGTLALLLRSTASTAYAGLIVLGAAAALLGIRQLYRGQIARMDLMLLGVVAVGTFGILSALVYDPATVKPVWDLFDTFLLEKMSSDSGQERAYWNVKSLQSFQDTWGLGVGMGSSRASSWPIAVLSQLGLAGAIAMGCLVATVTRGYGGYIGRIDKEQAAVLAAVRASAFASIVAASLINGSADPGILFFIALAVIVSARIRARRTLLSAGNVNGGEITSHCAAQCSTTSGIAN